MGGMLRVGGQSIQTKHSCVSEEIDYNRNMLGKENKEKRSVDEKGKGREIKKHQEKHFSLSYVPSVSGGK